MTATRYLIDVRPSHPQKGSDAVFYYREFDERGASSSYFVVKDSPHLFVSRSFEKTISGKSVDEVAEEIARLTGSSVIIHQDPVEQSLRFIHVIGPREMKKTLLQYREKVQVRYAKMPLFLPTSHTEFLRWQNPAFSKDVDREIFLKDYVIIDTETRNWWTDASGKFEFSEVVVRYRKGDERGSILFHDAPFTVREHPLHPDTQLEFYTNQKQLGEFLRQLVQRLHPLCIAGWNNIGYDLKHLKDIAGFRLPKGTIVIDYFTHAQNYYPEYARFSLEHHANMRKSISHERQRELDYICRDSSLPLEKRMSAFLEKADYAIEDGKATERVHLERAPVLLEQMLAYERNAESVCNASPSTIVRDIRRKNFFFKTKTFEDRFRVRYEQQKAPDIHSYRHIHPDIFLRSKRGFYPVAEAWLYTLFLEEAKKHAETRQLAEAVMTSNGTNAIALYESIHWIMQEVLGRRGATVEESLERKLKGVEIYNASAPLIITEPSSFFLSMHPAVFKFIGSGPLLSVGREKFVMDVEHSGEMRYWWFGIRPTRKKVPQPTLDLLFRCVSMKLQGNDPTQTFNEFVEDLFAGKFSKEDLKIRGEREEAIEEGKTIPFDEFRNMRPSDYLFNLEEKFGDVFDVCVPKWRSLRVPSVYFARKKKKVAKVKPVDFSELDPQMDFGFNKDFIPF